MVNMERWEFNELLDRASGFMLINLLWVVCSVFLVTLPAATVGLFTVFTSWARGKSTESLTGFTLGLREHWRKSTLLGLVDALLIGLVIINLTIVVQMDMPAFVLFPLVSVTVFVGLLTVTANLYIWPLLVIYDLPPYDLITTSIKLVFAHFGWTMQLLILMLLALATGLWFVPSMISLMVAFSGTGYLVSWGAWRVIHQYDAELQRFKEGTRS